MKVKVKRVSTLKYKEIVEELGKNAEEVVVPGTIPGVQFKGVYTNHHRNEIVVKWPVDRPKEAQEAFANEYCLGGWPTEEIHRDVDKKNLYILEGNECKH